MTGSASRPNRTEKEIRFAERKIRPDGFGSTSTRPGRTLTRTFPKTEPKFGLQNLPSDSGQLSAADYLEMVRTSARLLGNLSAFCSRLRRSSVLQSVNSRIVDMADEDEIFQDAGRKLFGEGFTKKAKVRDDELKSLALAA